MPVFKLFAKNAPLPIRETLCVSNYCGLFRDDVAEISSVGKNVFVIMSP